MADIDDKKLGADGTHDDGTDQGKAGGESEDKKFSQEDMDKVVQERVKREREQAEERTSKAIADALAEQERKAKLSESERKSEETKQREKEMADRERDITIRERRADAIEKLTEQNISTKLVNLVVDYDKDKMDENIENLAKAFSDAVQEGIEAKLAGKTPKVKGADHDKTGSTAVGGTRVI